MSGLDVVCFRVVRAQKSDGQTPHSKRFSIRDLYNESLSDEVYRHAESIDWSSSVAGVLTENLNTITWLSKWDMQLFAGNCQDTGDVVRIISSGGVMAIQDLDLTPEQKKEACAKFLLRINDFKEILSRDDDALNYTNILGDIYAVVLVYQGQYQGHIYTWLSPHDPTYCCAMGIRNRIDTIFTLYSGDNISNVSSYLFEGVRRFALSKGASHLVVPYPRPIMTKLLPKIGFVSAAVPQSLLKSSLAPQVKVVICYLCYEYQSIITPLATNPMIFRLID